MTGPGHRLDGEAYLASLKRDGEALVVAAAKDPSAAVPGCPGWDAAELVWHTGGVHFFWGAMVAGRLQDPKQVERPQRPAADELFQWYRSNLQRTIDALRTASPEDEVWTWAPEKNVAWVRRRMAQETAVHRWDAESATGTARPIDTELAVDGVDEFLEFFVTRAAKAPDLSVHLHATDADGEWLASIRKGRLEVTREHAKGNVAVRGEASDLLLLLWSRIPEAEVDVRGDRAALFRFLELSDLD